MSKRASLVDGDVIRTHPRDGFWGCAVVLKTWASTKEFGPMCHIGITPVVRRNDFAWDDIDPHELTILEFERGVRIDINDYRYRLETCIGIYANFSLPDIDVVGSIDPVELYREALTMDVGDGTEGRFPLCGKLPASLGMEAVITWRRVHEPELVARELEDARRSHEALVEELKAESGEKAKKYRARRRG